MFLLALERGRSSEVGPGGVTVTNSGSMPMNQIDSTYEHLFFIAPRRCKVLSVFVLVNTVRTLLLLSITDSLSGV